MASLDDQIDELFQLPLAEFTSARNALAKTAGQAGADIKRLEKPAMAAWVVNQLYWQHRAAYSRLIAASEALRSVQRRQLAGKGADVPAAEAAHDDARRALMDRARDVLRLAGDVASPGTMTGVSETLMALPNDERPGRLIRSLKPLGFQALLGMMAGTPLSSSAPRKPAAAPASGRAASAGSPPRPSTSDAAAERAHEESERRADAIRERERTARRAIVTAELSEVRRAGQASLAAAAKAKAVLDAARSDVRQLEARLAEATARVQDLSTALAEDERRAAKESKAIVELEERLAELDPP